MFMALNLMGESARSKRVKMSVGTLCYFIFWFFVVWEYIQREEEMILNL